MKQEHAIELRQAQNDIARALQRLEQATNRAVTTIILGEETTLCGRVSRYVVVELEAGPAENWSGA